MAEERRKNAPASPFQDSGNAVADSRQTMGRRLLPSRSAATRGSAAKATRSSGATSAVVGTAKVSGASKNPVCDLCCVAIIEGKEDALFCESSCQCCTTATALEYQLASLGSSQPVPLVPIRVCIVKANRKEKKYLQNFNL